MKEQEFCIFAFYQFKTTTNKLQLQEKLNNLSKREKIKGIVLIADEGINGTVSGFIDGIKKLEKYLEKEGFTTLEKKYAYSSYMPFHRMKIKLKKEIITFAGEEVNVEKQTGEFVSPEDWNKLIEDPEVTLLDIRNLYETQIGTFSDSEILGVKTFTQLKELVDKKLLENKDKKIAMFCTGGIRCEKVSSYMIENGMKNVFQLKGGILKYLENISAEQSKWEGECFVFDNRISVKNELVKGEAIICPGCRYPVTPTDRTSYKYEDSVSCDNCYDHLSEQKKENLRERKRQIQLSLSRNEPNRYIRVTPKEYQ